MIPTTTTMPMASSVICLRSYLGKSSPMQVGVNAAKRKYIPRRQLIIIRRAPARAG